MNTQYRISYYLQTVAILAVLLCPLLITNRAYAAGAISQGFQTTAKPVAGTVMKLKNGSKTTVEVATNNQSSALLGVTSKQSLLEVDSGTTVVQVVTSGLTDAWVSDINGTIKAGDKLTISPITGVGMKATEPVTVFGTAQTDFSKGNNSKTEALTDINGKSHNVRVATIPVIVNVLYFQPHEDTLKDHLPTFLGALGEAIGGNDVSGLRILVSTIIIIAGFVAITVMLYSAIRSGLTAIGRNPLAAVALRKSLLEVILAAIGTIILTLLIVYVILII